MKVVYYPDPVLQRIAEPVQKIDSRFDELIDDMFTTMFKYKGCGLAAPQVGVSKRLLVYSQSGESKHCNVLINPKILAYEGEQTDNEGCLSFPDIVGKVRRAKWIKVETLTTDEEIKVFEAEGFHARVILHEMDHLNGVLFTERMEPQDLNSAQNELKKMKKVYKPEKGSSKKRFASIR